MSRIHLVSDIILAPFRNGINAVFRASKRGPGDGEDPQNPIKKVAPAFGGKAHRFPFPDGWGRLLT